MKDKMNAKRLLVSFLVIASVLFLATAVSAAKITSNPTVEVNGFEVISGAASDVSVIVGDTIEVKVYFTVDQSLDLGDGETSTSNVRIRAELEGDKDDITVVTPLFDVKEGKTYVKTLTMKVPADFDDEELSKDVTLNIKIWNSDFENEVEDIALNVQRESYNLAIKSAITSATVNAGQTMPVDVVLKNVGYNDADDVYVTVSIPELNIQKSAYFGDLVVVEEDDDDDDTVSGRLNLEVPYTAKSGVYTLVVMAKNDETTSTASKEVTIDNSVSDLAMKSGNDLVLLNPTNQLRVYTVKYNSNEVAVVVPAVSSKTVSIEVPAGDYSFDVEVYSGESLLSTVKYSGSSESTNIQLTNPVFVLTAILAIVFVVLLVVLVVLITKKPQKTEEFGESYY